MFPAAGLGTHLFLIMVYLGGAMGFNVFLIKGFMDTIPGSLDESAKVDGAGPFQIFWRIVFPLSRPVLAVIFIITFTSLFAEVILASTLLTSTNQFTLAGGAHIFSSRPTTRPSGGTSPPPPCSALSRSSSRSSLPSATSSEA